MSSLIQHFRLLNLRNVHQNVGLKYSRAAKAPSISAASITIFTTLEVYVRVVADSCPHNYHQKHVRDLSFPFTQIDEAPSHPGCRTRLTNLPEYILYGNPHPFAHLILKLKKMALVNYRSLPIRNNKEKMWPRQGPTSRLKFQGHRRPCILLPPTSHLQIKRRNES